MEKPKVIILISGKRKTGKDYICQQVKSVLKETCTLIRISEPLKSLYADKHGLDLEELMSDGPYKEKYRIDMINWSDKVRNGHPGYFCEAACSKALPTPVWIVTDVRRSTDIKWFKATYGDKIKTARISADTDVRKSRGWVFTEGVDDIQSECDLDDLEDWDLQVFNNSEGEGKKCVNLIINFVNEIS